MTMVVIETTELETLLERAVTKALGDRSAADARPYSLREAAKKARRRLDTVAQALRNGALPATRSGKLWRIAPADCAAWIVAGCHTVPNDPSS